MQFQIVLILNKFFQVNQKFHLALGDFLRRHTFEFAWHSGYVSQRVLAFLSHNKQVQGLSIV